MITHIMIRYIMQHNNVFKSRKCVFQTPTNVFQLTFTNTTYYFREKVIDDHAP